MRRLWRRLTGVGRYTPPRDAAAAPATVDPMHYELLAQESLREVVRAAVLRARNLELPEGHALYLTFDTQADGVKLPVKLAKQYPAEMTVILQNIYLIKEAFGPDIVVQLSFDGVSQTLTIPYTAIRKFYDPGSKFGLAFDLPRDVLKTDNGTIQPARGPWS
ncbi:ClpXP protease specificity-enhancing factor SspB [Caulobacter sp. NIBR1757]|uniref:ClpXP protease specificity-enhancing factor SspB n=1 Tax=Caulobacter sp. NIBR1757 TaxID=3016000 RepID=UPI0022F05DA0|nr:ClpXP protease specificity-enhancing factor SspB [Caulobacter sp. NIBR1757]WGM38406.1 hypothetical protein AMEJIAPC_01309 [Caulobacter sp. NIBR1757]